MAITGAADQQTLTFLFQDSSGPGVPAEALPRLFDRLFRGYDRTIDSHIKNLRKKIAAHLPGKAIILTIYGVGYKLSA